MSWLGQFGGRLRPGGKHSRPTPLASALTLKFASSDPCSNYKQRGVTLIEMVIVVAIAGVMAVIALPAFSNGLDNLRMTQASDSVAAFLNGALNRAERRQQVVEVAILPPQNIELRSADSRFARTLAMPDGVRVEGEPRRILLLPGAVPPRFGIRLINRRGARRTINVDPITGVPQIERPDAAP